MFFEDDAHTAVEDESPLHEAREAPQSFSQVSDGGVSSDAPSVGRPSASFGLDGFSAASTAGSLAALSAPNASAAAVQLLIEATANERFSPEVLPYPAATVNSVVDLIQRTQQRVEAMVAAEKRQTTRSLLPFRPSDLVELELQRVQFFLCELLRCRLRKIGSLAASIWYEEHVAQSHQAASTSSSPEGIHSGEAGRTSTEALPDVRVPQRRNLSLKEKWVADRLAEASQVAVVESGLHAAPAVLQNLTPHPPEAEGLEVLPEPDLGTYVFGVALEDLGVVNLGEGDQDASRAIHAGELFLTPYHNFQPYVMTGQVRLV